jgi:broad specificity phosphatase PhoE
MDTKIILARHGETKWNLEGRFQGQLDTELSELGWEQAELLARALEGVPLKAVYASPLLRARETAAQAAALHGLPVQTVPAFTEISHGSWEGLTHSQVQAADGERLRLWHTRPELVTMPGGESLTDVESRAWPALEAVAAKHSGEIILVVAHDAVNKLLLARALGLGPESFWRIKQDNACVNVLEYTCDAFRVALLNSTVHLGYLISTLEQEAL